jgi:mono/diheme cytochrome c family protein
VLRTILIGFGIAFSGTGFLEAAGQRPSSSAPAAERVLLNRYCIACHNERLRTAEVMLDTADVENVGANAELWERVVRKLQARAMPPVGMPIP